eukprot:13108401-Heterocapsa_arctica.AAC.1
MQQVVGVPKRLKADMELPDDAAGIPRHRLQTPLERVVRVVRSTPCAQVPIQELLQSDGACPWGGAPDYF